MNWSIGEFIGIIMLYPAFLYFILIILDGIGIFRDNFTKRT